MKGSKFPLAVAMAAAIVLSPITSFAGQPAPAAGAKPGSANIVQIVLADDGEFDVLQAAVIRAGLVGALSGKGQFTVFAPTDAAFTTLFGVDEPTLIDVISNLPDEDVPWLTEILLYHVMAGRHISTSVIAAPQYQTLLGSKLTRGELVDAGVLATDISASNGIIHVIGGVLLPY